MCQHSNPLTLRNTPDKTLETLHWRCFSTSSCHPNRTPVAKHHLCPVPFPSSWFTHSTFSLFARYPSVTIPSAHSVLSFYLPCLHQKGLLTAGQPGSAVGKPGPSEWHSALSPLPPQGVQGTELGDRSRHEDRTKNEEKDQDWAVH